MITTNPIRIWDDDSKKPKNAWWSKDINSINTVIKANLPQSYTIRKALLKVYADFDGAGGLANVYMKYGFGGNGSISKQLGGEHKITKDEAPYPSSGIDIVSYLNNGNQEISKNNGDYLSVNIYTSNIVVSALRMGHAELTITYEVWYNSSAIASPQNGGSVSCLGGAWENSNDHFIATPNPGYKFVGWYRDGALVSTSADVYLAVPYDGAVFTARFELDKINRISVDTSPSAIVWADTVEASEITADTTKVYG